MKLLGVSGKIGSGKDHCTKLICKYFSFNQMSYGLKLKQVVALLTSSTLEECISHVGKNKYIEEFDLTIGQMQQKIGTDVMRTYFDENVLIKSMFLEMKKKPKNYIVSDVRFINEAMAVLDNFGIIIRINRINNNINKETSRNTEHISETDLDNFEKFDYIIDNNGTLKEFENKIFNICINKIGLKIKWYMKPIYYIKYKL